MTWNWNFFWKIKQVKISFWELWPDFSSQNFWFGFWTLWKGNVNYHWGWFFRRLFGFFCLDDLLRVFSSLKFMFWIYVRSFDERTNFNFLRCFSILVGFHGKNPCFKEEFGIRSFFLRNFHLLMLLVFPCLNEYNLDLQ